MPSTSLISVTLRTKGIADKIQSYLGCAHPWCPPCPPAVPSLGSVFTSLAPSQCPWGVAFAARRSHLTTGGYDVHFFRPFMLAFHFSGAIGATSRPGLQGTRDVCSFSEYLQFQGFWSKGNAVKQYIVFVPARLRDIAKTGVYANFMKCHF